MYIVPIAWLYVALMMAVAEATGSGGTVLGALMTFVLYGLAPVALVLYLMGTPMRRRQIKAREAQEIELARAQATEAPVSEGANSGEPDTGGQTPADPVTPVRKEP